MKLKKHWRPILDRFNSKLSEWKARNMSFGERLTLIKSVLSHLPLCYFSLFVAPGAILNELERIRHRFLWGGSKDLRKICWVGWDKVVAAKEKRWFRCWLHKSIQHSLIL